MIMRCESRAESLIDRPPFRATARPFLKWAGGKRQLLPQYLRLLPTTYSRYFEPFLGGGALFFQQQAKGSYLSDINHELIDCYQAIRDQVEQVIVELQKHKYDKDYFYSIREQDPTTLKLAARAARTIFLNRTGFNGLYRVNRSGRFNVPFGRYKNPTICDVDNLRLCSQSLRRVKIRACDYVQACERTKAGDFVYFDPPYTPISASSDFTAYHPDGFPWQQQERLAQLVDRLTKKGVLVMLSNSNVPQLRVLYQNYQIDEVLAPRSINSNAGKRGKISEIVVRNFDYHLSS
jgi:DNA adenine methylase